MSAPVPDPAAQPAAPLTGLHDRRGVLRIGAVTGGGVLAAWALGVEDVVRGVTDSGSAAAAAETTTGCATLTLEETQGPFWVDERLNRSDVRADTDTGVVQTGVLVTFTLTITDAGDSCTPQQGVYVDLWHANREGAYSDVSGSGNPDETGLNFLRGYQVTDANGQVTFTTIYPGWYAGRTTHLHYRVRTTLSDSSEVNFTSQLFFAESVNNAVYATTPYARSGTRSTTNSNDSLYDAALVMPVTGSAGAGYTGAFTVNLDFGGEDGTGTSSGSSSSGSSSSDTVCQATLVDAYVTRGRLGRRHLKVKTRNSEVVTPLVRLVRGDDVLAARRYGWWSVGTRTRAVTIPPRIKRGRARALVRFTDRSGNTKISSVVVHVPRRR